jgi:predicted nucleic acid-binding protein
MKNHVFVDSNIWIYSFIAESDEKYVKVEKFLESCFRENIIIVSFQVINEVAFKLKRKSFSEEKIRNIIVAMEENCTVVDFSLDLLLKASALREQYSFSFWDSLITASSISANCKTLYSEDMQDGMEVAGLTITNPLKQN